MAECWRRLENDVPFYSISAVQSGKEDRRRDSLGSGGPVSYQPCNPGKRTRGETVWNQQVRYHISRAIRERGQEERQSGISRSCILRLREKYGTQGSCSKRTYSTTFDDGKLQMSKFYSWAILMRMCTHASWLLL